MLDVGSNRGSFARAFLAEAPHAQLTCVEPDERVAVSCADVARVESICARIEDTTFPDEIFDIIHSCHTIEHLRSPNDVLAEHWRTLKPGGLLIVDAPNIALISADDILEEWFIDKHLFHFSAGTLARLFHANGFEVVDGPDPSDRENLLFAARKRPVAARPIARAPREADHGLELINHYVANRARNLAALTKVAADLASFSHKRIVLWGAGRLFDALVLHGGFDPKSLALLIDTHLKLHIDERHGDEALRPRGSGRGECRSDRRDVARVRRRDLEDRQGASAQRRNSPLLRPPLPRPRPIGGLARFPLMNAALSLRSVRSTHDPKLMARLATAAREIRTLSIAAIYHAGSGHPGGALSFADLLAALYGAEMSIWPERLADPDRDRFVLSKGHAAPALYAAGAHFGFCTADEALTLRKLGSPFQGHPHVVDLPWVETSTGSLGQGFSVALGMAMGLKLKKSTARVYAVLGDGEIAGRRSVGRRDVRRAPSHRQSARHHRLQQAAIRRSRTRTSWGSSRWTRSGAPSAGT